MLVPIFQILYYILLFTMALMSVFIIFHIVFYSYTFVSKILMLLIFVPVVGVLLFTNLVLFSALPLERVFSGLLP
ncbi:MAG: hypothetical protein ACD_5C00180G0002 [uncultured bacterium]|nr:MAG: hypothetical protein ACD_5C00180G0002 [uncultured bacterium]